jgi:anaerobic selenocysteine-containing dehydrogenase
VKLSKDIQRGIVLLYKAFWPSLLGWNANYLTPEEKNEKYGKGTTLHSVWVNVEKI